LLSTLGRLDETPAFIKSEVLRSKFIMIWQKLNGVAKTERGRILSAAGQGRSNPAGETPAPEGMPATG
jgi:hypothetical protein